MVEVRRIRRYLWMCGLLCAALPASASGAVTIGSDLAATPDGVGLCSPDPCTSAHRVLPPTSIASGGLLAPSDGVVVRRRIRVGELAAAPPDPDPDPQSRSLRLFVGHHPQIKKRVKVRATGFAETSLWLSASVVPGKAACPPPSTPPPRAQRVLSRAVSGKFRIEKRPEMRSRGQHHFCAYLGVGGSEDATASQTRLVRRQRLKGQAARHTVSRALRRHRFASRVVKKLKQRCRRSNRATFSCRFSSSFPGYRLTGRGKVRLNKRLSYRFRVKASGLRLVLTDKNEGRFPG